MVLTFFDGFFTRGIDGFSEGTTTLPAPAEFSNHSRGLLGGLNRSACQVIAWRSADLEFYRMFTLVVDEWDLITGDRLAIER